MEGGSVRMNNVEGDREDCSSGNGRPPIPNSLGGRGDCRHCVTSDGTPPLSTRTLVRHPSLVKVRSADISTEPTSTIRDDDAEYMPLLRSGAWADIGSRSSMEDVHVYTDNLMDDYGFNIPTESPSAFYGVFDGHGGKHAADFAGYHLPRFIFEGEGFSQDIERVIASAFLQTDTAFAEACTLDADLASGTTALAAIVMGSSLVVANAGDCRAVLSRRGKAIEMSRDHKPVSLKEKRRIEASGGYVYDGYLNGQLNVARALGDWHMEGLKGPDGGPLTADPEVMSTRLTKDDEFLILGCDGLWDVFMSQNAVDFARRRLQEHNDPVMCSKDLVNEALKRKSGDNLSVVVVCFQPHPPPNLVAPRGRVHRSISAEGLKELQSFLNDLNN
ncbi:probable protein phosphatase 2C 22 [Andrographis paniculata]|uniref:probable protein phosphatase 2C 22 n=1 Tax=Andrographis paniculata TaxID=175694 RepID=UPI0021E7CD26|nr:probable protein phosphatase 2C 22 [Andrographis paniculata]